jgi:hypothetical protein
MKFGKEKSNLTNVDMAGNEAYILDKVTANWISK